MAREKIYLEGMVVALRANFLEVELKEAEKESIRLLCTRRSRLNHYGNFISVGDRVFLEAIDWKERTAVVSDVKSRASFLDRPPIANVTDIFVVLAFKEPLFDFDQASRFLITAEKSGLNVNVIFTKRDLLESSEVNHELNRINAWGYEVFPVSVKTGEGLNALLKKLKSSELSVLSGPSGVGKTSLLNYFLPKISLQVGSLSRRLKRGKNTTRNVELFSIGEGSLVADSPGFSRPDFQVDPTELASFFPELREQLATYPCKFRNCLHLDEPGCGISKDWERYAFYQSCVKEMFRCYRQYREG